jgi:hypothetical protein
MLQSIEKFLAADLSGSDKILDESNTALAIEDKIR